MDATVAISQAGARTLMDGIIPLAHTSASGSGSWGPFSVSYNANVAVTETAATTLTLINAPTSRLQLDSLRIGGSVSAGFTFDLSSILPNVCIPPVQICVHIPFIGTVCTPQVCIHWPSIHLGVTLPFAVDVSTQFMIGTRSNGANWELTLLVSPFSLFIDPTPMVALVINAVQNIVSNTLGAIPLIGGLIAGLVNTVLGSLNSVLTPILTVIANFIRSVLFTLDLLSPTIPIPLKSFPKRLVMLPASGPADPEVALMITAVAASVLDHEIVATADYQ